MGGQQASYGGEGAHGDAGLDGQEKASGGFQAGSAGFAGQ